jgi:hypothetical protein
MQFGACCAAMSQGCWHFRLQFLNSDIASVTLVISSGFLGTSFSLWQDSFKLNA